MAIRVSFFDKHLDEMPDRFPPQVKKLPWREREVATLVYARGASTAKDVEAGLSNEVSNGAIRSMLNRLVGKGVLSRRSSGEGKAFSYVAAITTDGVKHRALVQLAHDYFGGSLLQAALFIFDLLENEGDNSRLTRAVAEDGQLSPDDPFPVNVAA